MNSIKIKPAPWRRMIAAITLPDFFTHVEISENPALTQRAFVITEKSHQAVVIASSPEAQAYGIAIGSSWHEAHALCPDLKQVPARLSHYRDVAERIRQTLEDIAPITELTALDEIYLDISSCQRYYRNDPELIAQLIHQALAPYAYAIHVGISGDKFSAQIAALDAFQSARKSLVLAPAQSAEFLANKPLSDVLDLGSDMQHFFSEHNISHGLDVQRLPASLMAHLFGARGHLIWLMLQGKDPRPVAPTHHAQAFMHIGKLLNKPNNDLGELLFQWHKLAQKIHKHIRTPMELSISFRCREGWRSHSVVLHNSISATQCEHAIRRAFKSLWFGEPVFQLKLQLIERYEQQRQCTMPYADVNLPLPRLASDMHI